jgi:cytochrome c-type biogenesis protein CcmH/NrfG
MGPQGSQFSQPDFVMRLVRARLKEESAALDEASRLELERVVADDPDYAEGHYLLGVVRERRGDAQGARRALETAVRLAPGERRYRAALKAL